MSRRINSHLKLLLIILIPLLTFCGNGYHPLKEEQTIVNLSVEKLGILNLRENEEIETIDEWVWETVISDGRKPRDIEVGKRADITLLNSKECVRLLDSLISKLENNPSEKLNDEDETLLSEKIIRLEKTDTALHISSKWISNLDASITLGSSVTFLNFLDELNPTMQKLTLYNLKLLFLKELRNELYNISAEVGASDGCGFDYIYAGFASEFQIVENDSTYSSQIFFGASGNLRTKQKYYLNNQLLKLDRNSGKYTSIRIPIIDQPKGKNTFYVVSAMKPGSKVLTATTMGYYYVR
jgi:hypothetical protein